MKTSEQLKGAIKNIANDKKLKPQEVIQVFQLERILERFSLIQLQGQFYFIGWILISSIIVEIETKTLYNVIKILMIGRTGHE